MVEFDIQGDKEVTQEAMYNDLYDEVISLTFNGYTLYADTYMLVDGKEYDPRVRLICVACCTCILTICLMN